MRYDPLLRLSPLSLPPLEPFIHLLSGFVTSDIHSGDHLSPIEGQRKTRQFEERTMFGVRDRVYLKVLARVLHLCQLGPCERLFLVP